MAKNGASESDALIDMVKRTIQEQKNNGLSINSQSKTAQIQAAYEVLKTITDGKNLTLDYVLSDSPNGTVGHVTIVGESVSFTNIAWFSKIISLSSNLGTYLMEDNRVRLDFEFA